MKTYKLAQQRMMEESDFVSLGKRKFARWKKLLNFPLEVHKQIEDTEHRWTYSLHKRYTSAATKKETQSPWHR